VSAPIVELDDISMRFAAPRDLAQRLVGRLWADARDRVVTAVDHVRLSVQPGEVVGLVGESGCGKSTLGRIVAGLLPPTGGEVRYRGRPLHAGAAPPRERLKLQMIFQDPMASLNPRMRVAEIIGEAPRVHGLVPRGGMDDFVDALLVRVGLDPRHKTRYPHQFSGGQRARIGIARALAVAPEFLVCDESVAALDVSIQAQVLNLFMQLRHDLGLSYLFITHDLGVVEHLADRVAVMYLGRIVETALVGVLFRQPNHPYTRALLADVPRLPATRRRFSALKGEIPSPFAPPAGCHFHPRCPLAMPRCRVEAPVLKDVAPGQSSACHLNDGAAQ
jgi:peptide/nickel transport system ATP-binding protein